MSRSETKCSGEPERDLARETRISAEIVFKANNEGEWAIIPPHFMEIIPCPRVSP